MIQFLERIPGRVYDGIFFCSIIILALLMAYLSPVHASPSAKMQEPGCVQFAKAGNWDIYECVDSKGNQFEANSVGMLIAVGN